MKKLVIVGAGGFGRELLQWVKDINKVTPSWEILGFIDDNLNALEGYECEYSVIGTIRDCVPEDGMEFACAIANPQIKEKITKHLKAKGAIFASVIHPAAYISDYVKVGEGLVMYPGSGINVNAVIGDFVTLLSAGVGHDAKIGDYCTVSSYCDITGGVVLEEKVFLGSRVTVVPHRKIGAEAYVATGSVVITNVRPGYKVMGNPACKMDF